MIEDQIYYNYSLPNIENIINKVNKIKKNYNEQFQEVNIIYQRLLYNFNLEMYYKFNTLHRQLILEYTKRIIDIFPQLKNIEISIFFHGSFAKGTNRMYSDIDLNFIYPEKYKQDLFAVEELISLIICEVFKIGSRDRIHNMMIYDEKNLNNKLFKNYCIVFKEKGVIKYSVRDTKMHLINKIYKSKRDIKDFSSYIETGFDSNFINEWCYSFLAIEEYDYYGIEKKIFEIKNQKNKNEEFYIRNIINEKEKILTEAIKYDNDFFIRSLNCILKKYYGEMVQKFLIIFSEMRVKSKKINFIELWAYLYDEKKLLISVCKYFWLLMKIEEVCHLYKIDFSYKSNENISHNQFCEYYLKKYNENFDEEANKIIEDLKFNIVNWYERVI